MKKTRTRRAVAHATIAGSLVAGALLATTTTAATAADPEPSPAAQSGVDWLERQLEVNDYRMPGFSGQPGTVDWGLTIDALIAIGGAGRGGEVSDQVVEVLKTEGTAYIDGLCTSTNVGSKAKTAYALLIAGEDPTEATCDGEPFDLIQDLRDNVQANGRIGATSNHFAQTLAMLSLARTDEGVPAAAVSWVESRQCLDENSPNYGGLSFSTGTNVCSSIDGDSVGFMLSGLLAAGKTAADPVVQNVLEWAAANQDGDGSFTPDWNPSLGNTNSTGLMANALYEVGTPDAIAMADDAATFIEGLQITAANATVDSDDPATGGGLATGWIGAIAYSQAAMDSAVSGGIPSAQTDQWRRASAQAILGLGLPGFGGITLDRGDGGDGGDGGDPPDPVDPSEPQLDGWRTGWCAEDEGLAVVVDFGADRGVEVRCRLDAQINRSTSSRITALHAVGYPVTVDDFGIVTTVDGVSASGEGDDYWRYSSSEGVGNGWGGAHDLPEEDLTNWFYGVCLGGCEPSQEPRYLDETSTAPELTASTVTLSGATRSSYGKAATVTVRATAGGASPGGKVTLSGAGTQTKTLSAAGTASFALPRGLRVGKHRLTARYSGSDTVAPSVSSARGLTVGKGATLRPQLKGVRRATTKRAGKVKITVPYTSGLARPTGKVRVTLTKGKSKRTITRNLSKGARTITLPRYRTKGTVRATITYYGNGTYGKKASKPFRIKVR